jgi:hypothetical protein
MEEEKQTELTPHESKTLFRLKQGINMKATRRYDLDKKAAVICSKLNVKVDKQDVTDAQGVHGVAFEIDHRWWLSSGYTAWCALSQEGEKIVHYIQSIRGYEQ